MSMFQKLETCANCNCTYAEPDGEFFKTPVNAPKLCPKCAEQERQRILDQALAMTCGRMLEISGRLAQQRDRTG